MARYMAANQSMRRLMVLLTHISTIFQPTDQSLVGQAIEKNVGVLVKVMTSNSAWDYETSFTGEVKSIHELLSPVSQTEAGTVRCVGLNYKEHAAEMNLDLPSTPTLVTPFLISTDSNTVQCFSESQYMHSICIRADYSPLHRGRR